jgi:hypothetical protein
VVEPEVKKEPVYRMETVTANGPACLLQLKRKDFEGMAKNLKVLGAGASLRNDYDIIYSFLASNYDTK